MLRLQAVARHESIVRCGDCSRFVRPVIEEHGTPARLRCPMCAAPIEEGSE